ncbi:MlaD family protein [Rhodococcus aetherivorans]
MNTLLRPALRLAAFCTVGVLAAVVVGNTLDRTVTGPTRDYAAEFTDVEGLSPGSDVTLAGVRVGRVSDVRFAPGTTGPRGQWWISRSTRNSSSPPMSPPTSTTAT